MTPLSKRVLALVAGGSSALVIANQFLNEREGNKLIAYRDAGGVVTVCRGVVLPGLRVGQRFTEEQCNVMNDAALREKDVELDKLVHVPMSAPQRAAFISFCTYNIGAGKCARSTALRELNAGNRNAACAAIRQWIRDGGKDCRVRSNNCYGQVDRRDMEYQLCLMD